MFRLKNVLVSLTVTINRSFLNTFIANALYSLSMSPRKVDGTEIPSPKFFWRSLNGLDLEKILRNYESNRKLGTGIVIAFIV